MPDRNTDAQREIAANARPPVTIVNIFWDACSLSHMHIAHFEKTQIVEKLNKVAKVFSKLPFCIILFGFFENTFVKNKGFAAIEHEPP